MYDPEEVKLCMEVLSEVDDIFQRTAQNRKNIVKSLKEKQEVNAMDLRLLKERMGRLPL